MSNPSANFAVALLSIIIDTKQSVSKSFSDDAFINYERIGMRSSKVWETRTAAPAGKGALKEEMNFFVAISARASIKLPRCIRTLGFDRDHIGSASRLNETLSHANL